MEIKFNHVSYIYDEKTPLSKIGLANVDLQFKENKINGIVGSNGSGKSTLIQLINALIKPSSGNVEVGSTIISKKRKINNINNLRYKIGLVFQNPEEQFFCNTVKKEIEFGMKHFKTKVSDIDKHITDALKMVGLNENYLELDPYNLSSGEKRLIAIASILAFNPKVVILDEPTVGLDYDNKKNMIKIIKLLKNRYKKTVIIVSHDTDFLHKIVDYVYVLCDGRLVLEGNKYEVFTNEYLNNYGVKRPRIIEFEMLVNKSKKKILYRDDINDLMKDVYRSVK